MERLGAWLNSDCVGKIERIERTSREFERESVYVRDTTTEKGKVRECVCAHMSDTETKPSAEWYETTDATKENRGIERKISCKTSNNRKSGMK